MLGLLCAEEDVGNLKNFQEIWDSCAQNKTSEISKNGRSGIMGLLCQEHNVGNINNCTLGNSGTPVRRTRRRQYQKNALSGIMGFLRAEQNVRNLNKCTFRYSGTPVRRTRRRKYQTHTLFRNSSKQNKLRCLRQNLFGWDPPLRTTL